MRASRDAWRDVPPEQVPFIMAGKWYLAGRLIYQAVVVGYWATLWVRGEAATSGWSLAGAVTVAAGYALRRWARAVLGERFRSFEVRREVQGLETGGPYAYLRHPGYVGLALMDAGLPLLLNVPVLAVLAAVPGALLVRRARLEDRLLRAVYS
jgi:protein-S-isoprenylcysteine O-methyltransferase Ste14